MHWVTDEDMTYYSLVRGLVRVYGIFYAFLGLFDLGAILISLGSMRDGILGQFLGEQNSILWLLSKDDVEGTFDLFIGLTLFVAAGRLVKWMVPNSNRPISFKVSELQTIVLTVARFYLLTLLVYFIGLLLSYILLAALRLGSGDMGIFEALVLLSPSLCIVGLLVLNRFLGTIVRLAVRTRFLKD